MKLEILQNLRLDDIDQIYSGKSGCMCGCRGMYREGASSGRILKNMIRYAQDHDIPVQFDAENNAIFVDDDTKNYVVFLKGEKK